MPERLPDHQARQRIASDLGTTFLVEAGAGSGKTTCLVSRMVALVTSGTAPVERIAAVTFTRKAAGELRERFQEALEAAARGDGTGAARAREALPHLGETAIGTIHSFCGRLLRERPIEAGLDPEFEELEEVEADRLLDRCWQEFLERTQAAESTLLAELARLGISPAQLTGLYKTMSRFRDAEARWQEAARPDLSGPRAGLLAFLHRLAVLVPREEPEKGWDALQTAYRIARWRRQVFGLERDADLAAALEPFEKAKVTLNRWPKEVDARALRDEELPRFVQAHVAPALTAWREHRYGPCIRFASLAVRYAETQRQARGLLDFGDLLLRARDLLRDHPGAREAFADRYRHLLVDEFQDTDPIQAEILFYLAGDASAPGTPWHLRRLRPGALFVVGDPRQSIYRFRRADIDTYTAVKAAIRRSGGEVLELITNFRSVDTIGSVVNAAFRGVFPETTTAVQAPFASMATCRPGIARLTGGRRLLLADRGTKKPEIAASDAEHVAAVIAWALAGNLDIEESGRLRPARPGDVMVLTQRKEFLEGLARALEAREIPYDISGAGGFAADPGVAAVLALLACLADPDDPVKLVAVLTGRLFGHSDQELYDLKQAGGRFAFLGAPAEAETPPGIPRSLARLHAVWRLTRDRAPSAAVAAILEALGLVPVAAASPLGAAAGGKLAKLVVLLEAAAGMEVADFPSAVEWLSEIAQGEVEPLSLLTGTTDVVWVLNLHRAKGLEAAVVFLAAPWGAGEHEPEFHVDRTGAEGAVGYFLVRDDRRVLAQPPGWAAKAAREAEYLLAERDRLRYVAATRAKQLLIVSESPRPEENPWAPLLPHIPDALPLADIRLEHPERESIAIDPAGCAVALAERDRAREAAALPGLRTVAVTELVKATGPVVPRRGGKGQAFGTVVHRCLEAAAHQVSLTRELVASYLEELEQPAADAGEILATVESVRQSDLWRRIEAADEVHAEVPFALRLDGADLGAEPGRVQLDGVIDLAFREGNRWVLVDYKTDRIDGDPTPYVEAYAPQLNLYRKAWEDLSGQPVAETLLFFTHLGQVLSVAA